MAQSSRSGRCCAEPSRMDRLRAWDYGQLISRIEYALIISMATRLLSKVRGRCLRGGLSVLRPPCSCFSMYMPSRYWSDSCVRARAIFVLAVAVRREWRAAWAMVIVAMHSPMLSHRCSVSASQGITLAVFYTVRCWGCSVGHCDVRFVVCA